MAFRTGVKVSLGNTPEPPEQRAEEVIARVMGEKGHRLAQAGLWPEGTPRIIIGTPQTNAAASQWVGKRKLSLPKHDGFHVQYDREDQAIYIVSGQPLGCLFGAFWLEEALSSRGAGLADTLIAGHSESPAFKYRVDWVGGDTDWQALMRGRPNVVTLGLAGELPHWKFRELLEAESGEKLSPPELDEAAIEQTNKIIAECRRWGLRAGTRRNQLEVGRGSLERKPYLVEELLKIHPEHKFVPTHNPCGSSMCVAYPHFWEVLRANIEEIFQYYPELGMLIVTTGDNGGEIFCNCRNCRHIRFEDRVRRFAEICYETIKRCQPECLFAMRLHNVGDWYWYNARLDMDRIARDLPKDMAFESKFSCPPTFDLSWRTEPGFFNGRFEQDHIVAVGYDNGGRLPATLFFASCHERLKKDVEFLADNDVEGVEVFVRDAPHVAHLEQVARQLWWDPHGTDPEAVQASWSRQRFGRKAGPKVAEALRRSQEIAERLQPVPWVINTVKNLNPWREYDSLRIPYPRLIYEGKETTLLERLSGSREFTGANVKKAMKQIDVTATARKVHDLFVAARESGKGDDYLDFYVNASEDTLRYAEIFRGYVGGYLQWRRSDAARGAGAQQALSEAFLNLLRAQTSWHLMSGLEAGHSEMKYYTRHYMWYITRELEGFDWLPHLGHVLEAVAAGETLLIFASDIQRRDVEGYFIVPLLGLEEEGDQIRVPEATQFYALDKSTLSEEELDLWYCDPDIFVRQHGEGRIIYTNVEERDTWYSERSVPTPALGPKGKRRFKQILDRMGLLPGQIVSGVGLKPYRDLIRWEGPFYNAGNYIETTRLYKLRRDDGSKWA